MQTTSIQEFKGYTMHSSRIEDKGAYCLAGFTGCNSEVARMTGSKMHYNEEGMNAYSINCLNDSTRYGFLIFDPQGSLIGESVVNKIDEQAHSTNFRIYIFKGKSCGKGIDSWTIQATRDFVFCERKLYRLSPDVFSFDIRAKKAYRKAGLRVEGILRDAIWDNSVHADNILMSVLEEEWKQTAQTITGIDRRYPQYAVELFPPTVLMRIPSFLCPYQTV